MSDLPARIISGSSSLNVVQQGRVIRATRRADVEVYEHALRAAVDSQKDQADSRALGDALTAATDEELSFLDYGLSRANCSLAKAEIVAQKAALFSAINNRRIAQRFQ